MVNFFSRERNFCLFYQSEIFRLNVLFYSNLICPILFYSLVYRTILYYTILYNHYADTAVTSLLAPLLYSLRLLPSPLFHFNFSVHLTLILLNFILFYFILFYFILFYFILLFAYGISLSSDIGVLRSNFYAIVTFGISIVWRPALPGDMSWRNSYNSTQLNSTLLIFTFLLLPSVYLLAV